MLRPFSILAVVLAASAGASASVVLPGDPRAGFKAVADRLHSTVIAVRARAELTVPGSDEQDSVQTPTFGTGVLIGDGLAVTTLHSVGSVVPGKTTAWKDIEVLAPGSGPVAAKIVASVPELDLAVLQLAETPSTRPLVLAPGIPAAGNELLAMGTDEEAITVVGVTLAAASGDELFLTSTRRMDSRYWGGPIFDVQGRLVGITLPSLTSKAINSVSIAALLERVQAQTRSALQR